MHPVLLESIRVDNNLIKVGYAVLVKMFAQHIVDVALEDCWSINKMKWDDGELIVAIAFTKCCLPLVSEVYPVPMIGLMNVKLHKLLGT